MEDFSLSEIFIFYLDNQSREGKFGMIFILIDWENGLCPGIPTSRPMT